MKGKYLYYRYIFAAFQEKVIRTNNKGREISSKIGSINLDYLI
jgi:hypothetical protein